MSYLSGERVDGVHIALPNSLHVRWAIRALRAGKPVLVEKPNCIDLCDFDTLARVRAAYRWSRRSWYAFTRGSRHWPSSYGMAAPREPAYLEAAKYLAKHAGASSTLSRDPPTHDVGPVVATDLEVPSRRERLQFISAYVTRGN